MGRELFAIIIVSGAAFAAYRIWKTRPAVGWGSRGMTQEEYDKSLYAQRGAAWYRGKTDQQTAYYEQRLEELT